MRSIARQLTRSLASLLIAGLLVFSILPTEQAEAAFPGYNGKIAFLRANVAEVDGHPELSYSINTMNFSGSNQQSLFSIPDAGTTDVTPEWSSNGELLTWAQGTEGHYVRDVYIANADGTGKTRVTGLVDNESTDDFHGGMWSPSFSPDGTKLTYHQSFTGFEDFTCEIYTYNLSTEEQELLTEDEGVCEGMPRYSPDGTKIAFFRSNDGEDEEDAEDDVAEIWLMNADGTNRELISSITQSEAKEAVAYNSLSLDWSPDGTSLVFAKIINPEIGGSSIFTASADGGEPEELKTGQVAMTEEEISVESYHSPSFTPEGDIIYGYINMALTLGDGGIESATLDEGESALRIMSAEGLDEEEITTNMVSDGTFVDFYELFLYVINPTVQPLSSLPESSSTNTTTLTSPNGTEITIETPSGTAITCSSVSEEASASSDDTNYTYPLGLVNFCFDTEDTDNAVTLTFITDLKPNEVTPRKYDPNTKTYTTLTEASVTETEVEGQHALQLTYTITDNGNLDLNPEEGSIEDPVGLATTANNLASSGQNTAMALGVAALLSFVGLSVTTIIMRKKNV